MLTFQVTDSAKTVQINCDQKGMETLIKALEKIQVSGGHVHLRAPSLGGHDLGDKTPWKEDAIGEVIITWGSD